MCVCVCVGGGVMLKPKQYARLPDEVKYKKQPSAQCRICGTINITKYAHNF